MFDPPVEPVEPNLTDPLTIPDERHVYNHDGYCVRCSISESAGETPRFSKDCIRAVVQEQNRLARDLYRQELGKYRHQLEYYEKSKSEYEGPYHVVNQKTGKHLGPFTTELDAALARTMSSSDGWQCGKTYNKKEFDDYLSKS